MLSDQDIELLELYLDGALTDTDAAALKARISSEVELQQQLASLRQARELRLDLWQSFETQANDALPARILAAIEQKHARHTWFYRILDHRQQIATVAACIAVFLMGWEWGANSNAYRLIHPGGAPIQPIGLITQQQLPAGTGMIWEVRVNDPEGKLLRAERFRTLPEAQAFIEQTRRTMSSGQHN
jgi:hypothetical protein